jgi:hypothetical protein
MFLDASPFRYGSCLRWFFIVHQMGQGTGYRIQAQLGTGVRYDPWNLQTEVKDDIICQIVVGYCWEFFDSGSLCWISLYKCIFC